jgi:hypothetical protein
MTTRYLSDTHDITGVCSVTSAAGVVAYAALSSATSIDVVCTHEQSGTVVTITATADAISGSETGAFTAACNGSTFTEAGRYAVRVVVEWGAESRTYPGVALTVLA